MPWDRTDYAVAATVGLVALGAFLPVLGNGFAQHWDDQTNFLQNPHFRGIGWPQLRWAWTTTLQGAYQPLAWMLFELEYLAWGLEPRGYHGAGLILHAAVAILFYALIRTLAAWVIPANEPQLRRAIPWISGLTCAVFVVHPLRVEVVAWASCQPYLPSAGFAILSVLAYVHGCRGGSSRRGWRFASVGLYAVALGFKAVPVGLPLVLLVLDRSLLGRRGAPRPLRVLLAEKLPYLIPAIAASWMAIQAKTPPSPPRGSSDGTIPMVARRSAVAGYGLSYYLEKTAWPENLSAYHFRPSPIAPAAPRFAVRLAAVAILGAVACALRRRWRGIPAALLCYAVLLAPNLGLVEYGLMLVADRYAYIATMPLFVVAALSLVRCVVGSGRPATLAVSIVVAGLPLVAGLISMSWSQCRTWRDSETLWAAALKGNSDHDAMLESNLGIELYDAGRVVEGMAHLRRAVAIDPADSDARESLGIALLKQGDTSPAIVHLAEAVRLAPGRFEFRHHLGLALARRGRLIEALEQLREAARLNPRSPDVHASIGDVFVDLRRRDDAVAEFTEAIRLVPNHSGAWRGLEKLRVRGRPTQ